MKAKVVLAALALMLGGSAMAQQRIDKIVEELEQKGVDVNKVVKRDPKTKQIVSEVKTMTFYSKEAKYANRLREAFRLDAENSVNEVVRNHGNHYVLTFKDGKQTGTYVMTISGESDKPKVSLHIVIKEGDFEIIRGNWDGYLLNPLDSLGNFEFNIPDLTEKYREIYEKARKQMRHKQKYENS